ncbi:hypothetical protein [Streptomyces radiopugnans]|uniref:Uncharacterized protein n=1 Tax=Streptomyces radiopugnans TaxID=403935 RepID=A0A1H9C3A9_9ACTN|nr:hypothetical protein [Streptomyces radiopugnans]SEP95584.1 hypothetical protein SAMN05216481_10316 [Streptomyces radiopugnans]
MIDLQKVARGADVFLDLAGVVIGSLMLVIGVETYRDGGSMGWPIAGSVLLLINLWVASRRFVRRGRSTPSP